jgi:hypothetical protein
MSERARRLTGLYSTLAAGASIVFAPLLALSYFAIEEGKTELNTGTVSAWAEPARDVLEGLVTFASADRVYATYTQAFALLFPAVLLCAWVTRRPRGRQPGLERWGGRLALPGYALFGFGLALAAIMLVGASASSSILDLAFMPFMFPGIVLSTIGSTVLGIGLLRSGYEPRLTAWLLTFALPLWIAGSVVLGHNSLGLIPLFVAWSATGWRLWRAEALRPALNGATVLMEQHEPETTLTVRS